MNRSKRRRINLANSAVATTSNDAEEIPPSAPYMKLIANCWDHIFDYLSSRDILVMGQTCKQLCQIAGNYIPEYFPKFELSVADGEVYYYDDNKIVIQPDFYQYIGTLSIDSEDEFDLSSNVEKFDSLKTIIFYYHTLNRAEIKNMQIVLKNIESIHLIKCEIARNMFALLTNRCPKLKHLNLIQYNAVNVAMSKPWNYPSKHMNKLTNEHADQTSALNEGLKIFWEKHTKLECLEIDFHFIWSNWHTLMESNIQVDLLHLYFDGTFEEISKLVDCLETLHERGFYKILKLSLDDNNYFCDEIFAFPRLEKLRITIDSSIDINCLANLTDLHCDAINIENTEILAKGLTKLERLFLMKSDYDEILTFVRHSKRLKTMIISENLYYRKDFDLFALNEERKKLESATKVLISVPDYDYLILKWKLQFLSLNLVKIVRHTMDFNYVDEALVPKIKRLK